MTPEQKLLLALFGIPSLVLCILAAVRLYKRWERERILVLEERQREEDALCEAIRKEYAETRAARRKKSVAAPTKSGSTPSSKSSQSADDDYWRNRRTTDDVQASTWDLFDSSPSGYDSHSSSHGSHDFGGHDHGSSDWGGGDSGGGFDGGGFGGD